MPSFLRDLRRRSFHGKSFRSEKPSSSGLNGEADNGAPPVPTNQSSSTLNTYSNTSSNTPPTSLPSNGGSSTNLPNLAGSPPPVPRRPQINGANGSKRYSINGMMSTSSDSSQQGYATSSPFAPRILSISDNSWVHQKVLLINGQIGDLVNKPLDGSLALYHHQDSFPSTSWPVCDSFFKALVHLTPGPNRLRLDFTSPKLSSGNTSNPVHSTYININYLPLNSSPPLQLAIIVAKDSPLIYDAVPERVQREGNGLDTAIRKFRMAAYLWQAFTGEQMNRNAFGRRCFRFEEEWQQGTLSWHDTTNGTMRNEIKIHIIRSEKTVREIQDLDLAQQYGPAQKKGDLFGIASEAVKAYFKPRPGQVQYVSTMFLDTHWDPHVKTVRGHAALGGGDGQIQLAIFGSHSLQSYPASIEEVVPAFSDCTRTNTDYVANDCNESGSNWEAANIGIGAHMHETGHLFGCPHQENGVMLRDYVRLNRTFTVREPYSTRTRSPGQSPCRPEDECTWHRLDTLRFRFHPCFRLPHDERMPADTGVQVWTADNNNVLVTAASGIAWIELFPEGDDVCHSWIDYVDQSGDTRNLPRQITLTEQDLRARLPDDKRNRKLKVDIRSAGGGEHVVEDFSKLASKHSRVKLPDGRSGYRGSKLGFSQQEGTRDQEVILYSSYIQTKLLLAVRVYHGFALDGFEFCYEDGTTQLFGNRGGKPGGDVFQLDTRRGEIIMGFYLRAGLWIDGLQILTSLGRKSEIYGNATGGSGHTLIPPRGYTIAGVSGSCGAWIDGFALIITR